MYSIQNRQKRAWTVPPVHATILGAPETHKPVTINPGDVAMVKAEHWDAVKKGNRVIEALLTGRHLVVTTMGKTAAVDVEELANPKSPAAPEELTDQDDRVKLTTKTEMVEVSLKDDAPKEGRGPGRPRKEG
jgi:translation initiation factor IF-1